LYQLKRAEFNVRKTEVNWQEEASIEKGRKGTNSVVSFHKLICSHSELLGDIFQKYNSAG